MMHVLRRDLPLFLDFELPHLDGEKHVEQLAQPPYYSTDTLTVVALIGRDNNAT